MILVDSNVLIDVLQDGQEWRDWSIEQLAVLATDHHLTVNQIAFAEVGPRMGSLSAFEARLKTLAINVAYFEEDAAFIAGVAFLRHRRQGGTAKMVLPDFFIGGHAQSLGATILTRDPRFYRVYFPTVPLICPTKDDHD